MIIALIYKRMPKYIPAWCQDFNDGPVIPIIVGFLGIAFWLRVARILETVIGKNKYINLVADNTYSIMINHFLRFMFVKTVYALVYKVTPFCQDFNMMKYKSNLWWYYFPRGVAYTKIIYAIAGIVLPILIQKFIDSVKINLTKKCKEKLKVA